MGIRGLTGFIAKNDLWESDRLQGGQVLIDGNNLKHLLFERSQDSNDCYGGDFHNYAQRLEEFFECLKACQIEALIILDGGLDITGRKFETMLKRRREQFAEVCSIAKGHGRSDSNVNSNILEPVFVKMIKKYGVKCVRTDFEADDYLTAIANHFDCPLATDDSDFFIANIKQGI